jgi:hypothetical protein
MKRKKDLNVEFIGGQDHLTKEEEKNHFGLFKITFDKKEKRRFAKKDIETKTSSLTCIAFVTAGGL